MFYNIIVNVSDEWIKKLLMNLNSVQETKHTRAGMMESALPLIERLQTVHHTSIVAIGRGCDEASKRRL